jgi:hypothetical protein
MAKQKNKLPPFVAIDWKILNSDAFKALSGSSGKALPYFFGKPKKRFNDASFYDVVFEYTHREAQRNGFSSRSHTRVIIQLVECGFLDPVDKGGLRGKGKSANRFRISKRWINYGRVEFQVLSWLEFQPLQPTFNGSNRKITTRIVASEDSHTVAKVASEGQECNAF